MKCVISIPGEVLNYCISYDRLAKIILEGTTQENICGGYYHLYPQNVTAAITRENEDFEIFPSISLFGEKDKIGEVEKIILKNIEKIREKVLVKR